MRTALRLGLSLAFAVALAGSAVAATVMGEAQAPKDVSFSFEGPFGTYDRAALQRGFQVYNEVCKNCHSLNLVSFAALTEPGGPEFTDAEAKAIAASYQIPADPNKQGQTYDDKGNRLTRPGILADHFPPPFPNEEAARATFNGALPPDLSVIVKAREGGPQYVYSILTGFGQNPPKGFTVVDGKYFNPYFAGWNISMPPPLADGAVTYTDGTKATLDQEAHDVVTFLTWAAEPKMEQRKRLGFEVLVFLTVLAGLLYLSYRRVWKDAH
ncbi:MAG: cytochrome c1 [Alphaproteobacteria bacterium]|nr:cytochrome c1 [Alphaproteobacteria bacterium]